MRSDRAGDRCETGCGRRALRIGEPSGRRISDFGQGRPGGDRRCHRQCSAAERPAKTRSWLSRRNWRAKSAGRSATTPRTPLNVSPWRRCQPLRWTSFMTMRWGWRPCPTAGTKMPGESFQESGAAGSELRRRLRGMAIASREHRPAAGRGEVHQGGRPSP